MFFDSEWLDLIARGVVLPCIGLLWVTALVRIAGLRSFSKMTSFDFVMTIAMGSLLGGVAMADKWPVFFQISVAMAALFAAQVVIATLRQSSDTIENALQNEPVILMRNGEIHEDALRRHRVARADLIAKLREANVLELSDVRAVVLETTGDISVLHGERLSETLLDGVVRT